MAVLKRLNQLLLNNNRVTRISDGLGRALPKLQTLVLTNNQLTTLTQLEPLAQCPTITSLSLVDNPVTKVKDYRAFVIGESIGAQPPSPAPRPRDRPQPHPAPP